MRVEHLFMGYIVFVVARFFWWAIRDELHDGRQRLGCHRSIGEPLFSHRLHFRAAAAALRHGTPLQLAHALTRQHSRTRR